MLKSKLVFLVVVALLIGSIVGCSKTKATIESVALNAKHAVQKSNDVSNETSEPGSEGSSISSALMEAGTLTPDASGWFEWDVSVAPEIQTGTMKIRYLNTSDEPIDTLIGVITAAVINGIGTIEFEYDITTTDGDSYTADLAVSGVETSTMTLSGTMTGSAVGKGFFIAKSESFNYEIEFSSLTVIVDKVAKTSQITAGTITITCDNGYSVVLTYDTEGDCDGVIKYDGEDLAQVHFELDENGKVVGTFTYNGTTYDL